MLQLRAIGDMAQNSKQDVGMFGWHKNTHLNDGNRDLNNDNK